MYRESASIKIIQNTRESIKRSFDLVQSARDEVLRIFSSINAFRRQVRVGVLHLFKESIEHGVKVRVLIPSDYQQTAAGLGAYSDSKAIALSYASIFDILWKQTQLYEKLSETYEQLKIHNKMQKGFLDVDSVYLATKAAIRSRICALARISIFVFCNIA